MIRERVLKVVLVMVGSLFTAAIYPVAVDLLHGNVSDSGDTMMMSLYCTLGIFLLLTVRNPSAHRSLIAFAAWSSFAHAIAMSGLGFQRQFVNERVGFWSGSGVLVVIGALLLALAPAKPSAELASATVV